MDGISIGYIRGLAKVPRWAVYIRPCRDQPVEWRECMGADGTRARGGMQAARQVEHLGGLFRCQRRAPVMACETLGYPNPSADPDETAGQTTL